MYRMTRLIVALLIGIAFAVWQYTAYPEPPNLRRACAIVEGEVRFNLTKGYFCSINFTVDHD